jgi:hypothetical protein
MLSDLRLRPAVEATDGSGGVDAGNKKDEDAPV